MVKVEKSTRTSSKASKSKTARIDPFDLENLQIVAWIVIATSMYMIYLQVRQFQSEYEQTTKAYQNYLNERGDYLAAERIRIETGVEHSLEIPQPPISRQVGWSEITIKSFALVLRLTLIFLSSYYLYDPKKGMSLIRNVGAQSSKGAYSLAGVILTLYHNLDSLIMVYWMYLLGSIVYDTKVAYDNRIDEDSITGKLYNFFGFNIPASVISVVSSRFSDIILLIVLPYFGQILGKIQSFTK